MKAAAGGPEKTLRELHWQRMMAFRNSLLTPKGHLKKPSLKTFEQFTEDIDSLEATEEVQAERDKRLADDLDDMRGSMERECYWCEDCQTEIPADEQWKDKDHVDHEVVRITVFAGWQIHVLNKAVAELSNTQTEPEESKK